MVPKELKVPVFLFIFLAVSGVAHCGPRDRNFMNPMCPTQTSLLETEMNPISIANYLEQHSAQLRTVEDFICCLPQRWRESYVVAHSSSAAQASTVNSSRVFLFDPGLPKILLPGHQAANVDLILTINGGNADLPQSKNVEMLFANEYRQRTLKSTPKTLPPFVDETTNSIKSYGEAELYDLSFAHNYPNLSDSNPPFCLLCHGIEGQKVGPGGPKAIFEPRGQWTRFHSGIKPCTGTERSLLTEANRIAKVAFESNPRFQCLKPRSQIFSEPPGLATAKWPESERENEKLLLKLDQKLGEINTRRVAKEIILSRDFQRYQYVIAALGACFTSDFNIGEWIPEYVMRNELILKNSLYKEVQVSRNLSSTIRKFFNQQLQNGMAIQQQQLQAIKELKSGRFPVLNFDRSQVACMNQSDIEAKLQDFNSKANEFPLLHAYRADTEIRGYRGSTTNVHFRFLFESRGIDTSNWQMILRPEHYEAFNLFETGLLDNFVRLLPNSSSLKNWIINSKNMSGEQKSKMCEQLKSLSLYALAQNPNRQPTALSRKPKPKLKAKFN